MILPFVQIARVPPKKMACPPFDPFKCQPLPPMAFSRPA